MQFRLDACLYAALVGHGLSGSPFIFDCKDFDRERNSRRDDCVGHVFN